MIYQESFKVEEWYRWDKKVISSAQKFFEQFSVYPNILIAHPHTLSQFNFITNISPKKNKAIHIDEKRRPEKHEKIKLGSFEGENFSLEFAYDKRIKEKTFLLIYDSDPDWENQSGESPIPRNEKELIQTINCIWL